MTITHIIRRNLLLAVLVVIFVGCISHFFVFRHFIHRSTDEILYEYKDRIVNYVALNDTLIPSSESVIQPPRVEEKLIENPNLYPLETFKDTLLYSELTGDFSPYRQLYFTVTYKSKSYLVNVNQPTIESDDLFYAIATSLLLLLILFTLFTYYISYSLNREIWRPLNKNLKKLYNYDLRAQSKLELTNSGIEEFDKLNDVVMRMVHKINEDYENSRIFIEDASHEMQTPLSIIKSKIEVMLNDEQQNEDQIKNISAMSRAVGRLSKLNKSLLLLTKINNDQFRNEETVDIKELIENYLTDMSELIEAKGITTQSDCKPLQHKMNPTLADILITNLFSNAIRHNIKDGNINITLSDSKLIISNTCIATDHDVNLFTRLVHEGKNNESIGLGLNIVKSICEKSGMQVDYDYPQPDVFRITIIFA